MENPAFMFAQSVSGSKEAGLAGILYFIYLR